MRGMVPKAFSNRHFWLRIFVFCWQLVSNTPFQTRWLCLAGVVHVCDASCRFQCWWKYVSHVAWLFLPVVKVLYWFGILISFDTSARFAQFVCFFLFPISSCYKVATVQDSYIKKKWKRPASTRETHLVYLTFMCIDQLTLGGLCGQYHVGLRCFPEYFLLPILSYVEYVDLVPPS